MRAIAQIGASYHYFKANYDDLLMIVLKSKSRFPTIQRNMSAFLVSAATVATAEIGDKTQLLALFLVSRYKKPTAIIAGMLFATIANHAGAAFLGQYLASLMSGPHFHWFLAAAFLLTGLWLLFPDKQEDIMASRLESYGVFLLTLCLFFLAEIGDKTQIATSLLAAQYHSVLVVTLGTTCGMLLANVPVIMLGKQFSNKVPAAMIRLFSALIFMAIAGSIAFGLSSLP